jgi:hypothetical protein
MKVESRVSHHDSQRGMPGNKAAFVISGVQDDEEEAIMTLVRMGYQMITIVCTYINISCSAFAPFDDYTGRRCIGVVVVAILALLLAGIAGGARALVVALGLTSPTVHARNGRARPFDAMCTSAGILHVTLGAGSPRGHQG